MRINFIWLIKLIMRHSKAICNNNSCHQPHDVKLKLEACKLTVHHLLSPKQKLVQ